MHSSDAKARPRPTVREAGFTLLELVLALTLFSIIIVNVLADREKSIHIAADAQVLETVRYLAQEKIDEIRHDPSQVGDGSSGDFSDIASDSNPDQFDAYTWEAKIERLVAVGQSTDSSDTDLYPDDQNAPADLGSDNKPIPPLYIRRLTLTVKFEPNGVLRPDLSLKLVTFIPDDQEEATKNQ